MKAGRKCCSGTCPKPVTATCPWKLTRKEEGKDIPTGKTCALPLCDEHGTEAAPGKHLCPWHNRIYQERL